MKRGVLDDLNQLRPTVSRREDLRKLDEAIERLTRSLTPSLWVDDNHLQVKEGVRVFNEERTAVLRLMALIRDPKSTIPDATVQDLIDRIVAADRLLAVVAISDSAKSDAVRAKANAEVARGDSYRDSGRYDRSIDRYKSAWILVT